MSTTTIVRSGCIAGIALLTLSGVGCNVLRQSGDGLVQQAGRLICTGCGGDANPASISADGRLLLSGGQRFGYEPSDGLYIHDVPTGKVTQLLTEPAFSPVVSPDLTQIAYHTGTDATFGNPRAAAELRLVANQVGANPRALHHSAEFQHAIPAAWVPDGKWILALLRSPTAWAIGWVSASDGTTRVLKSLPGRLGCCHDGLPSLSPDGQRIAYAASPLPFTYDNHIYVLRADNSVPEIELVKDGNNRSPVWTPDGKHLLFVSNRGGGFGLWSVNVDDGELTPVRADMGDILSVGVSKSGSYFYTRKLRVPARTFSVMQVGGPARSGSFRGDFPRWSPDGRSFAFVERESRSSNTLHVYSPGTKERKGYAPGGTLDVTLNAPQWFHDGKSVFVWVEERPPIDLDAPRLNGIRWPYRVDLETGAFKRLAEIAIDDPEPVAISSGDKTVYMVVFAAVEAGRCSADTRIVAVDRHSGETREVASRVPNTGIHLSADDTTLYMRTCGTGTGGRILSVDVATGKQRDVFVVKTGQSLRQGGLAVSPNSRTLAFIIDESIAGNGATALRQRLARIEVDGTGYRELLTPTMPTGSIGNVSWSRDGTEVFFEQSFIDERTLLRMPADGGVPRIFGRANVVSGSLSPDASRFMVVGDLWTEQQLWVLDNVPSLLKSAR